MLAKVALTIGTMAIIGGSMMIWPMAGVIIVSTVIGLVVCIFFHKPETPNG